MALAVRPQTCNMRLSTTVLVASLFGGILASDINIEEGEHFLLSLETRSLDVETSTAECYVVTPQNETIQLFPIDDSPARFAVGVPNILIGCSVTVSEAAETDSGAWELHVETLDGAQQWNDTIHVIVAKAADESSDLDSTEFTTITLDQIDHVVRPGLSVSVTLSQEGSDVGCFVKRPGGESVALSEMHITGVFARDSSPFIACGIQISPTDESFLGVWELCARNRTRTERCQPANITFAINDWQPIVNDLSIYSVRTGSYVFPELTSSGVPITCHIITPYGDDITLFASSNYPGIQLASNHVFSCRFTLGPINQNFIGNWTVSGRFERNSVISEIQQMVVLYPQTDNDIISAVPESVTISEGSDLYIRLSAPTTSYQTCKLMRPDDTESLLYHIDEKYTEYCGFIVPHVTSSDTGSWSIVMDDVNFKAFTDVLVVKRWVGENNTFTWVKDRPVLETVGPEDAVYCKVEDPQESIIFEGFGKCKIDLEKVTFDHHGFWTMQVVSPGRVLADEHKFLVEVVAPVARSVVKTQVSVEKPDVMMSCSLSTDEEVKACKFRDPSNKILLANHGVGEDRYVFHGTGVNLRSTANSHECGIRITNPVTTDLGLWRCAVQTDADEYYGFLTVLCPWAMMDPAVAAAVVSEPTVSAVSPSVSAVEGDSVTLSCSVQAPIRYCYFRARNGSIFNIHPTLSSESMQYVGAGLEAGECGVRFSSLQATESGTWSCHVGLTNATAPEQRANISVHIDEPLLVDQRHETGWIILEGTVPSTRQLEYCRFVRMDGVGFTLDNLPAGYKSNSDLAHGLCRLHVPNPSILEHHPWTVVAKVFAQDVEVARLTTSTFMIADTFATNRGGISLTWLTLMVIFLAVTVSLIAGLLGPKKSRDWTFRRASGVRDSIRSRISPKFLY